MTKEEFDKKEEAMNRLLNRLKQDPLFETRKEFGLLLMKHIDHFTDQERIRYEQLKQILRVRE